MRQAIDAEKKRLQDETSRLVSDARRSAAEAGTLVWLNRDRTNYLLHLPIESR